MDINKIVAKNLVRVLEEREITQAELAEKIGVSAATVSNWCNGTKMPRMKKFDAICQVLGVNRSDLMEEKQSQEIADAIEAQLLAICKQLNNEGKERILEYANFINAQGIYKKYDYCQNVG
jgi:transcriptional regulator with XRE-family HTH domain